MCSHHVLTTQSLVTLFSITAFQANRAAKPCLHCWRVQPPALLAVQLGTYRTYIGTLLPAAKDPKTALSRPEITCGKAEEACIVTSEMPCFVERHELVAGRLPDPPCRFQSRVRRDCDLKWPGDSGSGREYGVCLARFLTGGPEHLRSVLSHTTCHLPYLLTLALKAIMVEMVDGLCNVPTCMCNVIADLSIERCQITSILQLVVAPVTYHGKLVLALIIYSRSAWRGRVSNLSMLNLTRMFSLTHVLIRLPCYATLWT